MQFLASRLPGITQYYTGKVSYFADREHVLDGGRPISGDRYVAMEHGPVPSVIYDMITKASEQPDEIAGAMATRLVFRKAENKVHLHSHPSAEIYPDFSGQTWNTCRRI